MKNNMTAGVKNKSVSIERNIGKGFNMRFCSFLSPARRMASVFMLATLGVMTSAVALEPDPTNLTFTTVYGDTDPIPTQIFTLTVPDDVSPTAYLLSKNESWLSVTNAAGDVSGTIPTDGYTNITVAVSTNGLTVGNYSDEITVGDDWTNVTVNFDVLLAPDPTNLTFTAVYGETPTPQTFNLIVPADVSPTAIDYLLGTNGFSWLSVTNAAGDVSGTIIPGTTNTITVTIAPKTVSPTEYLTVGTHAGIVTVGTNWLNVAVNFTVTNKQLTVTNAVAANKVYDGTTNTTISGATLVGNKDGDNVVLTNCTVGYFMSKNAGVGITVATAPMDISGTAVGNYTLIQPTLTANITQATPTVTTWPTASAITYGQALVNSTLIGGVPSVTGTFAFATPGTIPDAGTYSAIVTFTPTDTANYETVAGTVSVTVDKATPTVTTWPTASAITYGQTLADSTLSGGTGSVAGAFAFDIPGTTPDVGTYAAAVTFTPTDTARYNTVGGSVNVTVAMAMASQTITFEAIPDQVVTSTVTLSATASSGLPVSFVATGPAVLDGNTLTFTGVGVVSIVASQAGNANWHAADTVTQSLNVRHMDLQFLAADFDGDGKVDPALYLADAGSWEILFSSVDYSPALLTDFGGIGWVLTAGDFDGDGKADPGIYNAATGVLKIQLSAQEYLEASVTDLGGAGYLPITGDFDSDGKADPAVYQASSGTFAVRLSTCNYGLATVVGFGGAGYTQVDGDFDGDGKADLAVYHAANGNWWFKLSAENYLIYELTGFGSLDYVPVAGDFDGDGKADPALYNANAGRWGIMLSASNYGIGILDDLGNTHSTAVNGDFDGDGKADPAVVDTLTGVLSVKLSTMNYGKATLPLNPPQ